MIFKFLILASLFISSQAFAKINVVTTVPDLAEVAKAVGGEHVNVESLLDGTEDAHFVDAVPAFVSKVSKADVVCLMGLDLEIGWMPKVLSKSGNSKVQPGGLGYCDASENISVLEKPASDVDRSMGDVHAHGNPHFNLSPDQLVKAASNIKAALIKADPVNEKAFNNEFEKFKKRMEYLKVSIQKKMKSKASTLTLAEYHKEFSYFFNTYKLDLFGSIEEKPGVPPSALRLIDMATKAKNAHVKLVVGSTYSPEKQLIKFKEMSGINFKKLPTMVQPNNKQFDTIEKLQNFIADSILKD